MDELDRLLAPYLAGARRAEEETAAPTGRRRKESPSPDVDLEQLLDEQPPYPRAGARRAPGPADPGTSPGGGDTGPGGAQPPPDV